jgi:hypothetical protein
LDSVTNLRHVRLRATLLLVVALGLVALLAFSAPALAKKRPSCAQQVIDDWADGRIDKKYPAHCYREALKLAPADIAEYSSFPSDVERALQAALANGDVPGGQIGSPFGDKYARALAEQRAVNRLAQPFNHRDEVALPRGEASPLPSGVVCVIAGCGSSASGLPVPLLVLGGVAFLLLAAGSVGMIMRKLQERRQPPPDAA